MGEIGGAGLLDCVGGQADRVVVGGGDRRDGVLLDQGEVGAEVRVIEAGRDELGEEGAEDLGVSLRLRARGACT